MFTYYKTEILGLIRMPSSHYQIVLTWPVTDLSGNSCVKHPSRNSRHVFIKDKFLQTLYVFSPLLTKISYYTQRKYNKVFFIHIVVLSLWCISQVVLFTAPKLWYFSSRVWLWIPVMTLVPLSKALHHKRFRFLLCTVLLISSDQHIHVFVHSFLSFLFSVFFSTTL